MGSPERLSTPEPLAPGAAPGCAWGRVPGAGAGARNESTTEEAERFRAALAEAHFTASVRRSKGREYDAAFGLLAVHYLHGG